MTELRCAAFRWSIMLLAVLSIVSFFSYAIWIFRLCSMWARHYGTLDEANHGRGHLPDKDVGRVPWGSLLALFGRPLVAILLADLDLSKSLFAGLSLGSPVRLFAATLTWDYFYCVYQLSFLPQAEVSSCIDVAHRSTHENKHLWKLHAHHHASVYPSPNMSATADYFQGPSLSLSSSVSPLTRDRTRACRLARHADSDSSLRFDVLSRVSLIVYFDFKS